MLQKCTNLVLQLDAHVSLLGPIIMNLKRLALSSLIWGNLMLTYHKTNKISHIITSKCSYKCFFF